MGSRHKSRIRTTRFVTGVMLTNRACFSESILFCWPRTPRAVIAWPALEKAANNNDNKRNNNNIIIIEKVESNSSCRMRSMRH